MNSENERRPSLDNFMHLCDHSNPTHPNMHHPSHHLQPTEIRTREPSAAALFLNSSSKGCRKAACVAQLCFCRLVDGDHVLGEGRDNRVSLCMRPAHIAKMHAHTLHGFDCTLHRMSWRDIHVHNIVTLHHASQYTLTSLRTQIYIVLHSFYQLDIITHSFIKYYSISLTSLITL